MQVPAIASGRSKKEYKLKPEKLLDKTVTTSADIVDGLLRLAGNPVSHGKTYNFSGGEAISICCRPAARKRSEMDEVQAITVAKRFQPCRQ